MKFQYPIETLAVGETIYFAREDTRNKTLADMRNTIHVITCRKRKAGIISKEDVFRTKIQDGKDGVYVKRIF